MLQAGNHATTLAEDFNYAGTSAPKKERQEKLKEIQQPRQGQQKAVQEKLKEQAKRRLVISILFCLCCGLTVGAKWAAVANMGREITSLKNKITSEEAELAHLSIEINSLKSLQRVEQTAVEKLKMQKPQERQLIASQKGEQPKQTGGSNQQSVSEGPNSNGEKEGSEQHQHPLVSAVVRILGYVYP